MEKDWDEVKIRVVRNEKLKFLSYKILTDIYNLLGFKTKIIKKGVLIVYES